MGGNLVMRGWDNRVIPGGEPANTAGGNPAQVRQRYALQIRFHFLGGDNVLS